MGAVLVSGGTGFVGAGVVRALLRDGHHVTVLNRGSHLVADTRQLTADRNHRGDLCRVLKGQRFDAVVDTNAYTGVQAQLLIEALAGRTDRIVVISSGAVYSDNAAQPPGEDQPAEGASVWGPYGLGKVGVEAAYRAAADRFAHCAIVRPPYIFGPGNSSDRETWFWTRQLAGRPVLLPGNGETRAQFVHNDDLAAAVILLASGDRVGFDVFNVAHPDMLSFAELAELLGEIAGVDQRTIRLGSKADDMPPRAWFPFRDFPCLMDPTRILHETSWGPKAALRERFAETLAHYSRDALVAAYSPTDAEARLLTKVSADAD